MFCGKSVCLDCACFHCQETLLGYVRQLARVLMEALMPEYDFDDKHDVTVLEAQGRWAAKLEVAVKPALRSARGLQNASPACLLVSASLAKVPGCDLPDC